MFFVASNRSEAMIFTSTGKLTSPIASEMKTLSSWRFLGAGSTISRSMSLSLVIWPLAAEPNKIILCGRAARQTRLTISIKIVSSTPIRSYHSPPEDTLERPVVGTGRFARRSRRRKPEQGGLFLHDLEDLAVDLLDGHHEALAVPELRFGNPESRGDHTVPSGLPRNAVLKDQRLVVLCSQDRQLVE